MSADDQVAVILSGLDGPVAPRPEFADALLARLLQELAEARLPTARRRPAFRLPRILPHAPPRLRLALIAIAVFLLLAGIATATYLGVKAWTSAGPRGVQYTNDFRLVTLARTVDYHHLAISPDGETLYALSVPTKGKGLSQRPDLRRAALVAVTDLRSAHAPPRVLLELNELKRDPALWDAGADLHGSVVPQLFTVLPAKPSIASNGDVALIANLSSATSIDQFFRRPPTSTSLLVRHRSGSVEKVLTVRELVRAHLLEPAALQPNLILTAAFASPDRLFLYVNDESDRFRHFYEIVDPDADGNWSNREIKPLVLPPFLGLDRRGKREMRAWYVDKLAADPSLGGEDQARSFLLLLRRPIPSQIRLYRVSDRNADGDARDPGEFKLLFTGRPGPNADFEGTLAPRTIVSDGKVAAQEFVAGGFTRPTRVSRITENGKVIDIARAFSRIEDVAASPDGTIYVLANAPDAVVPTLYALVPASPGQNAAPPPPPGSKPTEPATSRPALSHHTLAVTRTVGPVGGPYSQSTFFISGRGRRLRTLVARGNDGIGLVSPSAHWVIYWADRAIPNEIYTYAANLHTGRSTLLARKSLQPLCWPSDTTVLLDDFSQTGAGSTLMRFNVRTGARKVTHGGGWSALWPCTKDGSGLLLLDRSRRKLDLLNLATGKRQEAGRPLPHGSTYADAALAPDGRRVAYTVERSDTPETRAYIRETASGRTTLVRRARGQMYAVWSPAGDHLLLRTSDRRGRAWSLFVVDAEHPTVPRLVAKSPKYLIDHDWAPDGSAFAYTSGAAVRITRVGGKTRTFPGTAGYELFGWSPDGRYLGLVSRRNRPRITLVDTKTGAVRTVLRERRPHTALDAVAWLR